MRKSIIMPVFLSSLFICSLAGADPVNSAPNTTTLEETKTVTEDNNVVLTKINYSGSDSLAIGDPLGNSPVTKKHDLGPPATRNLSYGADCKNEACARARKRWNMDTTWQQDRKSGMSVGWGQDYKNTEE
jgi:hypothetical protein